jgi:hypothetical protein
MTSSPVITSPSSELGRSSPVIVTSGSGISGSSSTGHSLKAGPLLLVLPLIPLAPERKLRPYFEMRSETLDSSRSSEPENLPFLLL